MIQHPTSLLLDILKLSVLAKLYIHNILYTFSFPMEVSKFNAAMKNKPKNGPHREMVKRNFTLKRRILVSPVLVDVIMGFITLVSQSSVSQEFLRSSSQKV